MSVRQEHRYQMLVISQGRRDTDRQRLLEAAFMVRGQRKPVMPPKPAATRSEVRKWMRMHATDYETPTHLAEAANAVFDLPGEGLDDETHWVWDEALDQHEKATGEKE